jgi:hypothetical protein
MLRSLGVGFLALVLLTSAFFGLRDAIESMRAASSLGQWVVIASQFAYSASAIFAVSAMGARNPMATGFLQSWGVMTIVAASVAPVAYGGAPMWAGAVSGLSAALAVWVLLWIWKKRPAGLDG